MADSYQENNGSSEKVLATSQLDALGRLTGLLDGAETLDDYCEAVAGEIMQATLYSTVEIDLTSAVHLRQPVIAGSPTFLNRSSIESFKEKVINKCEPLLELFELQHSPPVAVLCYPIIDGESILGTIFCQGSQDAAEQGTSIAFLKAISQLITLSMRNAVARGEPDQVTGAGYEQLFESIAENIRLMDPSQPMRELLDRIVQSISQATGYRNVILELIDEDDPDLILYPAAVQAPTDSNRSSAWQNGISWQQVERFLQPSWMIGGTYFLPSEHGLTAELGSPFEELASMMSHEHSAGSAGSWQKGDLYLLPLYRPGGHPIGLIALSDPESGQRPSLRDNSLLEILASFAVMGIERARLVAESRNRDREVSTLFEVSHRLQGALDPERILEEMADYLIQIVDGRDCTVYQWDRDKDEVIVSVVSSKVPDSAVIQRGTAFRLSDLEPIGRVLNSQSPLLLDIEDGDIQTPERFRQLDRNSPLSLALLPMTLNGEVSGVVELLVPSHARDIGANKIKLLNTIINQAASALENSQLLSDTMQRERFFAALGRVTLAINETVELSSVLTLICRESLTLFDVDGAYIWRKEDQTLVGAAAQGHEADQITGSSIQLGRSGAFASAIVSSGRGQYCNNFQHQTRYGRNYPTSGSTKAVIGVPLKMEESTIGVLVLIDTENAARFDSHDVERMTLFAAQAAIAIRNAQLVTELRELNEQLDARVADRTIALGEERDRVRYLLNVTTELSETLDEHRVVARALELVSEVVQATNGIILLIDPASGELVYPATYETPELQAIASGIGFKEWIASRIIRNRRAQVVDDISNQQIFGELQENLEIRSMMAVPLTAGDEAIGVMMLFHEKAGVFSQEQLELVKAAARQVGNAISNAQLFLLIRDQAEKLGIMLREESIEAAKNQAILESIADGVIVTDEDGYIVLANYAASDMLHIPQRSILDKPITDLLGLYAALGDTWINTIRLWSSSPGPGGRRPFLAHTLEIDDLYISVHLSPVFANNQFFGTVAIFRDVTHAVEVDRMKSEFVSTVSHELRTPMTSIMGYADLMLMGIAGSLTEAQKRHVQVIKSNAERMTKLVNDLLDLARIESGKTVLDLDAIDVADTLHLAVNDHLQGLIEQGDKTIETHLNIDPELPTVTADGDRLLQIVTNLLDNAYNYTPTGGHITISARSMGDVVLISVRDTGIGIREELQGKIFERFYRAQQNDVQEITGTGLGLSIVRSLVLLHGGTIEIKSKPAEGSEFMFTLPIRQDQTGRNKIRADDGRIGAL